MVSIDPRGAIYIIIQAVSTPLNGKLVVVLCRGVLEWSPAPHEGLQSTQYKETCSPVAGAVQCSI